MTDSELFLADFLEIVSRHDLYSEMVCNVDPETREIMVGLHCTDTFWWARDDVQGVTPENLPILKQCVADLQAAEPVIGDTYVPELFCARIRGMRPQGAWYDDVEKCLWPLFDSCGPERGTGMGNPYKPGQRKRAAEARKAV